VSNTLGNQFHGRAATASRGRRVASGHERGFDEAVIAADADLDQDIWWDARRGGTGEGYNINAILPIYTGPLVGMQGWFDTVCSIRRA
jgi:hypothetical protein